MKRQLIVSAALIAAALSTASFAHAKDAFLTGAEIRSKQLGRTISGSEAGERYSETLLKNGSIEGQSSSEPFYEGEWEISGNEICFYYEDDEDDEDDDEDCARVILNGNKISFIDEDGKKSSASLR